ncbi:MAG: ABC transporter permease [Bacillota bacterium]
MLNYMIRRLVMSIPVILGVVLVVMFTLEVVPGDPAALMLGEFATEEAVRELRTTLGLDKPLMVRYVNYLAGLVRGDLGRSVRERRPVIREVADAFPFTLKLSFWAFMVSLLVGVPSGVISAVRKYSIFDNLARLISLLGLSMPVFWIGLFLIIIFSLRYPLFPVGGHGTWKHLVLPSITLGLPSIAIISRMVRSSVLEILGEDYVRTARAKGLAERVVIYKHALRNAMLPVLTVMGLQIGQLMGGAVLTENVFGWPGMGRLMVRSIFNRDFVLLQGTVLVFALSFVLVNLIVDLSYAVVDPRVTYK